MSHRITGISGLKRYVDLSDDEADEIERASREFRWAITPYYASLMDRKDRNCPIRKQAIPSARELEDVLGEEDPLHEEKHSPTRGLIHLYPDRVAFCVTNRCAMFCRHCVRKRIVGKRDYNLSQGDLAKGIRYIREHEEVRDVLITGGDPLVAQDAWIESLLREIRAIDHVEIIRIGTRTLCTMPQRITNELCDILSRYHPIWINTQFNHPKEITEEAAAACDRLLRAGVPLGNQSVLLRGINDDTDTMKKLVHSLVKIRVRPYYLYQCEVVRGTAHFRTPVERGLEIIQSLQGFTTGFAVPRFVVDTPIGKVPVAPQNIVARDENSVTLRNYEGKVWQLPNSVNWR
ncbi:MAG TPA: KamA family radical SAM protein [Firmicutes bacterium]|nr:KamA family radical SAM protein [Bacillota bacterium]